MPQSMGLERAGHSLATEQNVKSGLAGGSVVKNPLPMQETLAQSLGYAENQLSPGTGLT